MVNYGRTRREWMVLTVKFSLLNLSLIARKPSVLLLRLRVLPHGKIHGRGFRCCCCGGAPTTALGHTVDNQVIGNLLHSMKDFSGKTEEIEYVLT